MAAGNDTTLTSRGTAARERIATVWRSAGPSVAGFALPFALIVYLALRGGGYDSVIRGEVGVAVWWIVGLGALVGALPVARPSRAGWIALGLLVAFCAWTALGIGWSESSERTVAEVGRISGYIAVFALALAGQGREGLRLTVSAVGAGIGAVGFLAALSRLDPSLFPASAQVSDSVPGLESRLAWPLDYWNGLAGFLAIGVPLLLVMATSARAIVARALAAAAIPAVVLAMFLTLSRGGAVELAVGLAVLLAFHPRRLALALPALFAAIGSGLTILSATQRDAVVDGTVGTSGATSDGMVAVLVVVCAGVGLLQAAVALADRYDAGPRIRVGRRATLIAWVATGLVLIVAAIGLGAPTKIDIAWDNFKGVDLQGDTSSARLLSGSGSGRYQFWDAALAANASDPVKGIGAGTYEYWWAREGELPLFVRDAHSLYLENLAETGIIGFLLIGGAVVVVLLAGARRTLAATTERRVWLAAALAGAATFAFAAGIDWMWELTVVPVAFLLLAAALLGRDRGDEDSPRPRLVSPSRLGLAGLAVVGLIAVAIPLSADDSIRASQAAFDDRQVGPALDDAEDAQSVQPYAATPELQRAYVLELGGDFDAAAEAARAATVAEPTNWRTWLALSRLEAKRGNAEASVDAYRRARDLNPRSPLFAGDGG